MSLPVTTMDDIRDTVHEYIDTDFRFALEIILKQLQPQSLLLLTGGISFELSTANVYFDALKEKIHIIRYDGCSTDSSFEAVVKAVDELQGVRPDLIIAVGGGRVLNFAKLVAIYLDNRDALENSIPEAAGLFAAAPMIAIPTTSGSGNEATSFAFISKNGVRYILDSPRLQPPYVIIDSRLTQSLSPEQTAICGMDALCKAMEALWARNATGISRQYAWRAISMILPHIEKACKEGDMLSRRSMSLAAYLAGKAIHISNMTGPHALSGYLTDHMGLHPGEALAINMELFIEMNLPSLPESLQSDFLSLFNVRNTEELAWYISNLKHRLGLKMSIAEAGIDNRDALETYLDSVQQEYMENNPVKPCKGELFRVYCNMIPNIDSQGNNGILLQNR